MAVKRRRVSRWTLNTAGAASLCTRVTSTTILGIWSVSLALKNSVSTLQHRAKGIGVGESHLVRHDRDSQKAECNE